MSDLPTYADRAEWRAYQPHLPPAWRLEGERIPAERWWPFADHRVHLDELAGDGRATVVLLHGGGGNGRVLMPLGVALRDLGCDVVAPDLPGYGLTRVGAGVVPTMDGWAALAAALVDEVAARGRGPIVVFGLSLGGLLAYATAARTPKASAVVATTLADVRDPAVLGALASIPWPGSWSAALLRRLPRWLRRLRLPIRWLCPMDRIANDPALSRAFVADPLAGGSRVALGFLASFPTFDVGLEPERFATPLLCAHPAADRWTPPALSRPFFERITGPKRWVDLEGCGHVPVEAPGASVLVDAFENLLRDIGA